MIQQVPVLYLDLDGTVRLGPDDNHGKFVNKPRDVAIFPGIRRKLLGYKSQGWRIVGISNQGGIALGHTTEAAVQACMERTDFLCGRVFDLILYCPHHPQALKQDMQRCTCRKPLTGMLYSAVAQLTAKYGVVEAYPFSIALLVGDMTTDEQCAKAARVKFMYAKEWRKNDADKFGSVSQSITRR